MSYLHLNLKGEYFDAIKNGEKDYEFRLLNPYWTKRLYERDYDNIFIKKGYPKAGDKDRIIKKLYHGYETRMITHKHFGDEEVAVFAIYVGGKEIK